MSPIFGGTGGHLADTKENGANQESAGRADSRGGGALFCHGESVQSFRQREGGMESDGGVGRERYDLTGFGVADFLGGAADGVEGTEAAESNRFFCCERLGHVFQESAEDFLAFDVRKAEGLGEGAGEVGLGQGLLGLFSDVVFNVFGDFTDVRRGFAKDFPEDVVPGEVLLADVFI